MLFRQSDLAYDLIQEANNILNESVYLDESESIFSTTGIALAEVIDSDSSRYTDSLRILEAS